MKGLSVLFTLLLFIAADQLAAYLKRTARRPTPAQSSIGQLQARRSFRSRGNQAVPPPLPTVPGVGPRLNEPQLRLSGFDSDEIFE